LKASILAVGDLRGDSHYYNPGAEAVDAFTYIGTNYHQM